MQKLFIILFTLLSVCSAYSKTISVGLEAFPPFVLDDGSGLSVDLIKKLDKKLSEYNFKIQIAPYKRIKAESNANRMQLIGHTPYKEESKDFYKDFVEINWSYPVCTNFLIHPSVENLFTKEDAVIGTLVGNKELLKSIKELKHKKIFEHSSLESLLKMLERKRVDAVWFASAPIKHYQKKLGYNYFVSLTYPKRPLAIGLAVKKSKEGMKLKKKIEHALSSFDWRSDFDKVLGKKLECR